MSVGDVLRHIPTATAASWAMSVSCYDVLRVSTYSSISPRSENLETTFGCMRLRCSYDSLSAVNNTSSRREAIEASRRRLINGSCRKWHFYLDY